jgi:hypothetical protein
MINVLKKRILSIIPLYISKECPAFNEIAKAIEEISDEKFIEVMNQPRSIMPSRIQIISVGSLL